MNNNNSSSKLNNSKYADKDLDGTPDFIDNCFDPPSVKESKIADEKKREDEKKRKYNFLTH